MLAELFLHLGKIFVMCLTRAKQHPFGFWQWNAAREDSPVRILNIKRILETAQCTFVLGCKSGQPFSKTRYDRLMFETKTVSAAWIRSQLIGANSSIQTPFGTRALTYADYVASGRSLEFVEKVIREKVLPFYANIHDAVNS
jgi:hypothetical protein